MLRKALRSWIGINETETAIVNLKNNMRKEVGCAVTAMINGETDAHYPEYFAEFRMKTSTFDIAISRLTTPAAIKAAKEYVNSEEFVDSVVDRIMKKQIR